MIALDDAKPEDALLRRRAEDALAARALSLESDWAMRQQQPPERILRPLIEALRRDPGNLPAFERMVRTQESMKRNAVKFLNTPAGEAILREIAACRVPTLASREWRSYEDIVVVIRALAADSVEKGRPELAADYLSEACELTPAAAEVRLDYVAALSALGELDGAMSELKAAVSGGVVPAASLTGAPGLDALRSRSDFSALLQGATSRP
ncbi:MAG: hypothetical protein HZB38_08145 [Planctomycetes bacterium]|nr:hypothetical protein [Planctomycetota bacterium]